MPYTPPDSKLVALTFAGAYTPPDARLISIDMVPPVTGGTQSIYPNAIGDYGAGAPSIQNKAVALYPSGIADTAVFGTLATANLSQGVTTTGTAHAAYGAPEKVWNFHTFVRRVSVGVYTNQQTHTVRNQHEYLRPGGINSLVLGVATTEREDRGRHTLRYVDYFGEAGASPSGGVADFGFHTTDYVFRIVNNTAGGSPRAYYMHRYDRQTWATDGTPRYTEDPTTGDFFYPEVSAGFVNLNGSVYLACRARRSDDSLYHAILQLDSAGEYVASVDTGLGVNDYIYAITAVGNRIYFCTRTALYEGTGLVVSPLTSGSFSSLRGSTAGLFSLIVHTTWSVGTLTRHDLNTGGVLASVPTDASVLAVTDHVVWTISHATARAYDLALTPLSEVSVAMFAPQEGVADIAVSPWVSVSANLVAVSTSQSFVLLYGEAERQTVAGYFPIAHGGPVPSTVYEYNNASLEYYSPPPDFMRIPASPWPPRTAIPRAVDVASYTRQESFNTLQLLSDTEAYLTMDDAFVVPHSGAGSLPPSWRVRRRAIVKATVHVESVSTAVLTPLSIAASAVSQPTVQLQWQIVSPTTAKHSLVNEAVFRLKNRAVSPPSINPGLFGDIALRSNLLRPVGFDALSVTIPDVTDKRQYLFPASVSESAIMGDLPRVWNFTARITPDSAEHSYFANFQPIVENWTKEVRPSEYIAGRWGVAQITNKAVVLHPEGLDATIYGTSDTTNWYQYRDTAGTNMALFGGITIANAQLVARPNGKDMSAVGGGEISLKQRRITLAGIAPPLQDSELSASLYLRSFGVFGGISAPATPVPDVSHGIRRLFPQTFLPAVFGRLSADLVRRELHPEGVFFSTPAAAFGLPRLSSFTQTIALQGQEFGLVEVPGIARNEVAVDQLTLGIQTAFGTTQTELSRRYIQMFTTDTARYGEPAAWNWRTYVSTWSPAMPDVFGTPTAEQRNKQLNPLGYDMARVSAYADISNNARLMEPTGDDLSQFGAVLVADRIRHMAPSGDELSTFGVWFTVINTRQIIDTSGVPRPYAGVPHVWRNEQLLDAIGCGRTDEFGGVLTAPRIRTVVQYRYADPVMGLPIVDLHVQYVAPQGFAERFGWTAVEHFRNEARIFGTNYARYGEPLVQNFNPQALVYGIDMPSLPAAPWVSFRVRQIDLAGQSVGEYQPNRPAIEFRARTVAPRGYALDVIPRTHDIRWDIPQIAPTQRIVPDGIGSPQIPPPFVGATIIFPESTDQLRCGRPELAANSIWPTSGLSVFSFVAAPMVSLRNRTIFVKTTQLPAVFDPSRVVMSPYVVGPFGDIRADWLIDAHLAERDRGFDRPFFGAPTVTNFNRAVTPQGTKHGAWGLPVLATNKMAPDGWDSNEGKFGMTDFAGPIYIAPYWGRTTDDYIPEVPAYNFDTALYGQPDLAYPVIPPVWSPYITPQGLHTFGSGRPSIESTIRNVYPIGVEYKKEWVPRVWLHPPFRLYPESAVPPEPVIAQIAFRIREVLPQGDDFAVVCEEDAQMISARFRVRNGASRYVLGGIAPEAPAILQITHRNRSVVAGAMPEGVTSSARVQAQNIVVPAGVDTAQLGIIRRAVYGELYPYAPDTALYGYPRTNRRAYTGGVAAPAVADIRIARPLRPQGADCMGAGGAAVTNPYGCRDRVIIVGGDTDFSTFGGAHATN